MSTELAALKKQRANNKCKLTLILKYAKEADINTPIEQLSVRLHRAEELMREFTQLENDIFRVDENEASDTVYEENYYNAIASLNAIIREKNLSIGNGVINLDTSNNTTQFGVRSEVKLPKIHIPCFSGEYSEWQSFFDLYTSTIHEASSLNAVQKFQYLKGLLRGEAATLLRHINVTENNYIGALNKLRERYDRKKHIINSFIRTFVEQSPVHTSNVAQLKRLMDTSDEVIRGLKALGDVAESRDHWLIYLLTQKLDDKTKALWAETAADFDNPEFPDFLKFLARRIDTLESLNAPSKRTSYKPEVKGHIATTDSVVSSESHVATQQYIYQCAMCQNTNHSLFQCHIFQGLDVGKRKEFAKNNNRCFNCLSSRHPIYKCPSRRRCQKCGKKHHSLLHSDEKSESTALSTETTSTSNTAIYYSQGTPVCSILPTAVVKIVDESGNIIPCRALLDSGSQTSFITESCAQRLKVKRRHARVSVSGLAQSGAIMSKGSVTLIIKPTFAPEFKIDALVLPKITNQLPQQNFDLRKIRISRAMALADPRFHKRGDIDILIGADHFFHILQGSQGQTNSTDPLLHNTVFGWVVSGRIDGNHSSHSTSLHATATKVELIDIDKSLKRFWELETVVEQKPILSPEETFCEKQFKEQLQRNPEGRFVVRLPFKEPPSGLGLSLPSAIQRLRGVERRVGRDPQLAKLYNDFLFEYLQLNHMTEIPQNEVNDDGFYLPHHGVIKGSGSSSKIRVVFDGSAKTSSGLSLNDCLAVGSNVQSSLYAIILRFREHKRVFSADVQKMYRQVVISPEDRQFQKIIWRTDPAKPIRHFRLNTVTYGLASSPFLATRAIQQVAEDNQASNPRASRAISSDMYVDDIMTGTDNENELVQLQNDITSILSAYGFQLRKWRSNCMQVLANAPSDNPEDHIKELQDREAESYNSAKVLGISWNTKHDTFIFTTDLCDPINYTKRAILSEVSRIFDPLGWLSPVVITTKMFMQTLWADNLNWDDALPTKKKLLWEKIRGDLKHITAITIPRFINISKSSIVELHGFCDSSQLAYAAVVYFKITQSNGDTVVNIITAKTKVAPLKQQTLPRLELCAAVLLTQLINLVSRETQSNIQAVHAWTDSTIVLDWLGSHPKRWHTFVGNRTADIISSLPRERWSHVPSGENPADCATRGLSPGDLKRHSLWWNGPDWLHKTSASWPPQSMTHHNLEERTKEIVTFKVTITTQNNWYEEFTSKYSSFRKLQRVLGYILRFAQNATKPKESRVSGCHLRREELFRALYTICKADQQQYYHNEIASLQTSNQVHKCSTLKALNPFFDDEGIIRVGGRLQNSGVPYSTKHPIIIHPTSNITMLILRDTHLDNKHAGPSLLLSLVRQEFWIPNGKCKAKQTVNKCVICVKFKANCQQQLMGTLPNSRVEFIRPFMKTGLDYAGPITIHLTKGRGQKSYKSYICLFVCLSTKAVHLELVSDLSSDSFLGALKRFTARRGVCLELHSDNGTNFIGADSKLREEFSKIIKQSANISNFFSSKRITWHFIPPSSPHFGGIWESAIKSTKFHLKRVIGKNILTLEEMNTLLAEVEAILNSRPLCSSNEADDDYLTPSHFILGHATTKIPELDITNLKMSHLSRWQMVQHLSQHFWKRWYMEYLTSLQQRSKWRFQSQPLSIDDIVVIKDNNLPVHQWMLGRVVQLHPGPDGLIRVVTLKTKHTEVKRPIHKLCLLPVSDKEPDVTQETPQ